MIKFKAVTKTDIDFFDQNGYLIIRNALDENAISTLIEAGDRLIHSNQTKLRQKGGDRYDSFRNSITLDDAFIHLIDWPEILPIVLQLLGANLQIMTSHLIYKYPDPSNFPDTHRHPGWHRDYLQATRDMGNAAIPRLLVKCAYYLTDLREPKRGATMVAAGSNHLEGNLNLPKGRVDPPTAVEPSLKAGDCLIFENRTFHAGAIHRGTSVRKAIMIGYGYRWVVPMDFVTQATDFVDKLTPLQRYLVGEPIEKVEEFLPGGTRNPLKEWCQEHGIPTTRHPQPQRLSKLPTL